MVRERATDTAALVAAAARTFHHKGYRNSTIDDIAAAAGISRPTVYKYADSKQHLLDLVVDQVTGDLGRRLDAVLDSGEAPQQRLQHIVEAHIEAATTNRTFYAIVLSEQVELSESGRAAFRAWAGQRTRDFRALLDECVSVRARPAAVDTTVAAHLVLSMLSSLHRWYDPHGAVAPSELSHQIAVLLDGIVPGMSAPADPASGQPPTDR